MPLADQVSPAPVSTEELQRLVRLIDQDVAELLSDGKLAAARYTLPGPGGPMLDRSAALTSLLAARAHYERLLAQSPVWEVSQGTVVS